MWKYDLYQALRKPTASFVGRGSRALLDRNESETGNNFVGNSGHSYQVADLEEDQYRSDPDLFYSEEYKPRLSSMIDHVIDTEGPIHEDVLVRRIARHHGFHRAGRQIRDIVVDLAKSRRGRTNEGVGVFFWRKGTVKDRIAPARYKDRNDEMRNVDYMCEDEIRAIGNVLFVGNDPVELARRIGIGRLTQGARRRLSEALGVDV